jgi:thiol:disulfide interchange protein DsbD
VKAESPGLELGTPSLPRGSPMTDEYFGAREVYLQQVEALIPYARLDAGAHPLQIRVSYQGCAMAGLCYPVIVQVLFPDSPVAAAPPVSHPWEGLAIGGGLLLFFGAGVNFRKTRRPAVPGT